MLPVPSDIEKCRQHQFVSGIIRWTSGAEGEAPYGKGPPIKVSINERTGAARA